MSRYEAPDGDEATEEETKAIAALQRLAKRWPRTLTLASMGGSLVVVHGASPTWQHDAWDGSARTAAVLADVSGIPNTGGDW